MFMVSSTIPAGCWDLDIATGSLALCPRSRAMFGFSRDSSDPLTESEWTGRFHPDDLAAVRQGLAASLEHRVPYAERFRTIHPNGSVQLVLGIGRPLEDGGRWRRFVGWNFDVATTGEVAADWISAHPQALSAEHFFSVLQSGKQAQGTASDELPPDALLERAETILRVRRARERLLGRAIMGEPAFDLLLWLYVRSGQKEISLSSLARPAGIPYSSAVRWIRYLTDRGLVERTESKTDRRLTCVQLTPSGRAVLKELFTLVRIGR
jgi:DNA-binding MarR family transcriptional regulator